MYFRKNEFVQAADGINRQISLLEKQIDISGTSRIVCRKKGDRLYYTEVDGDSEKGITGNNERIKMLTHREFMKRQLEILKKNEKAVRYCAKHYCDDFEQDILENMSIKNPNLPANQILFSQGTNYREQENYEKNPAYPEERKYATINGVMLRSKSEREIGNALESVGIEYESDVLIKCGLNRYYADFIIKRPNGTKLVWEHFGLEHDHAYMAKNTARIKDYMALGMRPWEDLIWTLDSDIEDSRVIRRIIQRFILSEVDRK